MHTTTDPGRARVRPVALFAAVATLLGALALAFGGGTAFADTSPNVGGASDTNTRAAFAPAAANNTAATPGATLAGAVGGQSINIHVDGTAGKFFGVAAARLCRAGLNITLPAQMNPNTSGNCIAAPLPGPTNDDFVSASAAPSNTSVDFVFKVGSGTEATHSGPGSAITCDSTTPCAIWLQEAVDTTIHTSGNMFKHYDVTYAGNPTAPTAVTPTRGNQTLGVSFTAPSSNGNSAQALSYTVSLSPADAAPQTGTATSGYNFTGLNNFTAYTVSVTATSTAANGTSTFTGPAGTAGPSTATTPVPPAITMNNPAPGDQKLDLSWSAGTGGTVTSYDVEYTDTTAATAPVLVSPATNGATNYTLNGLTNGHVYSVRARAIYGSNPGSFSNAVVGTPNGRLITQTINVRRPQGALVLTQVCGTWVADPHAPTAGAEYGASNLGNAPTFTGPSPSVDGTPIGQPDGLRSQYPYPVDANGDGYANYKTNCGVNLSKAKFLTQDDPQVPGDATGKYFRAVGAMNQVTVVDTRDDDPGFNVNGQMGTFTTPLSAVGRRNSFSGGQMGWVPTETSQTGDSTDATGFTYSPNIAQGAEVFPNTLDSSHTSLAEDRTLASAGAGHGLGIAVYDAKLVLYIPVWAQTGNYTGTLTISAI